MKVSVKVIMRVHPEQAPLMVAKIGSVQNLIDHVIHPMIDSSFRNQASSTEAMSFMQDRTIEQEKAEARAREEMEKYHVECVRVLISQIILPEGLMHIQTRRVVAAQQQEMFIEQQKSEQQRIATENTRTGGSADQPRQRADRRADRRTEPPEDSDRGRRSRARRRAGRRGRRHQDPRHWQRHRRGVRPSAERDRPVEPVRHRDREVDRRRGSEDHAGHRRRRRWRRQRVVEHLRGAPRADARRRTHARRQRHERHNSDRTARELAARDENSRGARGIPSLERLCSYTSVRVRPAKPRRGRRRKLWGS
ncbi:MAG: hypothetical protein EXR66_02055 [Dehalococcoidia bacterium]|nr:hypothetical protein [Dehalococcoidia bacterium]